ncbi:MAG: hypothetical protein QOE31_1579 [Solirubrobacteraceae bacterium]|nr:hypothetical protein [Solirubrobacteraceae bacterium]
MISDLLAASTGTGIGMAIGGIAAVLVISAVFYVIGRGEDRDRAAARDAQPQDGAREEPGEARRPAPTGAGERRLPAATRRRRR